MEYLTRLISITCRHKIRGNIRHTILFAKNIHTYHLLLSVNQDGEILITDIDPEIFRMLLGYLYTSIPLDVKDKVKMVVAGNTPLLYQMD